MIAPTRLLLLFVPPPTQMVNIPLEPKGPQTSTYIYPSPPKAEQCTEPQKLKDSQRVRNLLRIPLGRLGAIITSGPRKGNNKTHRGLMNMLLDWNPVCEGWLGCDAITTAQQWWLFFCNFVNSGGKVVSPNTPDLDIHTA